MEAQKLATITLLIFTSCLAVHGNRQKYGGRVLNIAPNECTSPTFPNVTGTCMISLECQQRSGTVIGACRDGLLFGACCIDANVVATTKVPEIISTISPQLKTESTTAVFEILPSKNTVSSLLRIQTVTSQNKDSQNIDKVTDKILPESSGNTLQVLPSTTPSQQPIIDITASISRISSLQSTSEIPTTTIAVSKTSTTFLDKNNGISYNLEDSVTKLNGLDQEKSKTDPNVLTESVTDTAHNLRTSAEGTTADTKDRSHISSLPVETTTSTAEITTVSSPTTKFFYGKIKYSPKPMKFRSTTIKTVWTRPPTTETSYSVFATSEEEDDDEVRKPAKRVSTERVTASMPVSTEAVTPSMLGLSEESKTNQKSTEEITISSVPQKSKEISTTTPSQKSEESTTSSTSKKSEEITTSSAYLKSTEEITTEYQRSIEEIANENSKLTVDKIPASTLNITETTVTPIEAPQTITEVLKKGNYSSSLPQKSVRIVNPPMSHRIGAPNREDSSADDSSYSNSDGWDNKLDDFVNQVVEGIAEELDKSNIDDVVFKSSTTTTTTTVKPTTNKSNKKAVNRTKSKSKGNSTKRRVSSKQKKKPTKKVTISKDNDSTGVLLDYRKDCGVKPLARQSRIVGGTPSNYGSWPWHVIVKETVWWGIFSKIKCGGVLIGSRHVLTAAHCQPQQTGKLSVVLGVTDSDNPNTNAVTKGVKRVIRHPLFNPRSYENDIAILELDSPVEFQPHIVPICMPDLKEVFEGSEGIVTGMGLLRHDGERPLVLHEVDVPILNNSDCQSMFRRSGNSKPIKESFICAGYPQGLKDSCGGDSGSYPHVPMRHYRSDDEPNINDTVTEFFSGGPLSVRRTNGQWVLAGTVSHGIKCAVPNQPGVYMRTTWYRPWIEKVTRIARGRESTKCHGPPGTCDYPNTQPKGILDTLFRVFRLARKFWKSRK